MSEELVWVEDRDWRPVEGKRCRQPRCPRPAVAEFRRPRYGVPEGCWWAYCSDHLYGGRYEPVGRVVLIGVHPQSPAAERGYTSINTRLRDLR